MGKWSQPTVAGEVTCTAVSEAVAGLSSDRHQEWQVNEQLVRTLDFI